MVKIKKEIRKPAVPIKSSFPRPNMEVTYAKPTSYIMTEDELAAYIVETGSPTMLLSSRRTPMQQQRPGKKKAKV